MAFSGTHFLFNPIHHGLYKNLFTMGGIWPPSQKMAGNALFEIKLGRITKSDVKIKKNPNMFNMTSL